MGQREDLETLRTGLLSAFEVADAAVKAQIAGQLRAVVKDLAAMGGQVEEVTAADEITARREARIAGSGGVAQPTGRGQPRRRGGSNRTG